MTLSPEDIQNKEFNVRFRGFDADEVDNFLEDVAEQYLLLQVEKKKYKERTAKLKEEMVQLKEEQKSFQKAFIAAQKIAEEMQEKGRRESEEMLEEAREEIDRMRAQAEEERKNLEDEVESLRQVKPKLLRNYVNISRVILIGLTMMILLISRLYRLLMRQKKRLSSQVTTKRYPRSLRLTTI